jgi:hypothetical protein
MIHPRIAAIAILGISLASASCGGRSEGYYPVRGQVLYKGEPAAGAIVYFHPDKVAEPSAEVIASGVADSDGRFWLESGAKGDGALPGKYQVAVEWPEARESPAPADGAVTAEPARGKKRLNPAALKAANLKRRKLDRAPSDRLKGRYADKGKLLLSAEVKPLSNQLPPFELKD